MTTETTKPVIELGFRYRDRVTGYEGVAIARYSYLTGCDRVELQRVDKDGKPEGFVFDDITLDVLDEPNVMAPKLREVAQKTGGPRDTPDRPSGPTR